MSQTKRDEEAGKPASSGGSPRARLGRWCLLGLLPLLAWASFSFFSMDQTEQLSRALLFMPGGDLNEPAINAALQAKFPAGSSVIELKQFVQALGGGCSSSAQAKWSCAITISGTLCVATKLELGLTISPSQKIQQLEAKIRTSMC